MSKLFDNVSQKDLDLIYDFSKQAWALSEEEIGTLEPGNIQKALDFIRGNESKLNKHCFTNRTQFEIENPDIHLLGLMRKPEFFPFTCKMLFNTDSNNPLLIMPYQNLILNELWIRQFPMLLASRGAAKSYSLAIYALLRMLLCQGSKMVIVGSAFRQAKIIFEYMERLWNNSPVYRDLCGSKNLSNRRDNGPRRDIDRCEFIIGDSVAIAIPVGDGEKIRGIRSNYTLVDEFKSINLEIYEQVIQAFGAVTSDPVRNTKDYSKKEFLKRIGLWNDDIERLENTKKRGNQNVLSGTPSYSFNHFYKYWKEYKSFIETKNEPAAVRKLFNGPPPESFDARDFSIIQLPYDLVPKGYMDDKTVDRAKQISNSVQFGMEYGCVFITDSDGFFKRSLIRKCEVGVENDKLPKFASCEGGYPDFSAVVRGEPDRKYFYGIDPASENDRFAVTLVEAWSDHRRIVYCWTTNKSDHREKLKRNVTSEHDFYKFCTRKIRDLMKVFPPARLMIDSGGGGITMRESFRDLDKLEQGEEPIYEFVDEKKPKAEDELPGQHIIEMCVFRDTAWVSEANHGMKKDMEDQILLFPCLNSLEIGLAMEEDKETGRVILDKDGEVVHLYDNLEDCMLEIEELKEELTMIVVTANESGSEKWGTPAHKIPGQKKGVLRKDRYSSLLIANMGARQNHHLGLMNKIIEANAPYNCYGGFAREFAGKKAPQGKAYSAPSWFKPCFGNRV